MSTSNRFDAGQASRAPATHTVDFTDLTTRVKVAMDCSIATVPTNDDLGRDLGDILRAMWDTHGSMVSIYKAAERIEQDSDKRTGRWMDALLLARPQYDALFVAMLLAHDYSHYSPWYRKAGWAAEARWSYYVNRYYRNVADVRALHPKNLQRLKKWARDLGIGAREWIATLAEVRGKDLRCGATTKQHRIRSLPLPSKIIDDGLLMGKQYTRLAELLWQQWKPLCDPAHVGMSLLVFKGALRGGGKMPNNVRASEIQQRVIARAVYPSFVAVMTLVTILALRFPGNADLQAKVVEGWRDLAEGTLEGNVIWEGWARKALGVLPT